MTDWVAMWAGIGWCVRTQFVLYMLDGHARHVDGRVHSLQTQFDNLAVDVRNLQHKLRH